MLFSGPVALPMPSSPWRLSPQQKARSVRVTAQASSKPASTRRKRCPPTTAAGVSRGAVAQLAQEVVTPAVGPVIGGDRAGHAETGGDLAEPQRAADRHRRQAVHGTAVGHPAAGGFPPA